MRLHGASPWHLVLGFLGVGSGERENSTGQARGILSWVFWALGSGERKNSTGQARGILTASGFGFLRAHGEGVDEAINVLVDLRVENDGNVHLPLTVNYPRKRTRAGRDRA